ncbi:LysR family hydrogen peroxide-inducible transcriptional activator [Endobacter medicaginis]|uniref:LysR family hydrogen peroxide-inducible transcriptional activator n=1 Tax=Endobacter medicaginis TaxID=1181271 RepID=A0A850NS37_9PROT|nr:LysR substrate-binding domain-containing protein [Endobacter medicaginis]MBB3172255.1 LysR family hydrogen peroxide-inducible transcriptional activator [Endobacter medicaginis]MCX5474625.1 LysR substrate-binding domain-containing protein [Endobacter medicaginis]NVN30202.1 LysR family transcriptional regulator [Endobacter medicaginis]
MAYLPLSGLSLRDIEYVVAVDELRNFSRAAEQCGVSQAGLSEQVRKLELILDVTLFERSRRHVAPTPQGAKLIAMMRDTLASARQLLQAARNQGGPLEGVLRIGVLTTLGPYYLPRMLPQLRQHYPSLALRLSEAMTAPMLQQLQASELDLALLALPAGSDALTAEPLFDEPFMAVFPAGHPLVPPGAGELSMDGLDGPELLLLEDGHCLRQQALSLCAAASSSAGWNDARGSTRLATGLEMLWHMIAAGEGYSLIPRLALDNRAELDSLVTIRALGGEASRRIGLVWRSADPRRAAFSELATFLRAHAPASCRPLGCGQDTPPA